MTMQQKFGALAGAIAIVLVSLVYLSDPTPEGFTRGTRAPDLRVYDADGQPVRLSDFAGQYRVVNFWAWWCGPCIDEAESLYDLQKLLGDDVKFLFVGINTFYRDEQPLDPSEFAEGSRPALDRFHDGLREATLVRNAPEKNVRVVSHLLETSLFDFRGYWERQFRARTNERYGIPVTYLIDPRGRIRLVVHTKQDWRLHEQMIRDFVAGKELDDYHSRFIIPAALRPEAEEPR